MSKLLGILAGVILAGLSLETSASGLTVNSYIGAVRAYQRYMAGDQLTAQQTVDRNFWQGYAFGFADGYGYAGDFCIPEGANYDQLAAVIAKFVGDHPDRWNESIGDLAREALVTAFPCKK